MTVQLDENGNVITPTEDNNPPTPPATPPPTVPLGYFTKEQVEEIRKQEKDKLYGDLQKAKEEAKQLKAEKDAREKATSEAQQKAEEEARKAAEVEMSAKELLAQREAELRAEINEVRLKHQEQEQMWQLERRYQQLQSHAAQVIAANASGILPHLQDVSLVQGESEEEINAKVQKLVNITAATVQDLQQAQTEEGRQSQGVSPFGGPPVGPENLMPTQRTYTPEQIKGMSMKEYAKFREQQGIDRLDSGNRGLFG